MAKYIPLDALVAEIERRKEKCELFYNVALSNNAEFAKLAIEEQKKQYDSLKDFINSLEVKEVDLEKEIDNYISNNFFGSQTMGFFANRTKEEPNDEDIAIVAKHFFELGLKAQHDNWKVVDNINPPQADRNKIYCVFTKQHYILAKVINHPQDEDLLQWKCTEFPHYRYDMCEGDKYMQIV